jgi:hypothetical protein
MFISNLFSKWFKRKRSEEVDFMEESYSSMMEWALGDDWVNQNIKDAPKVWGTRHPEMPPLRDLKIRRRGLLNAAFYIFQISGYWFNCDKSRSISYEQKIESKPLSFCCGFAGMLRSFWMQLRKPFFRS